MESKLTESKSASRKSDSSSLEKSTSSSKNTSSSSAKNSNSTGSSVEYKRENNALSESKEVQSTNPAKVDFKLEAILNEEADLEFEQMMAVGNPNATATSSASAIIGSPSVGRIHRKSSSSSSSRAVHEHFRMFVTSIIIYFDMMMINIPSMSIIYYFNFSISMVMRDANKKSTLWTKNDWNLDCNSLKEESTNIPADILLCDAVSREIEFFSAEPIADFQMQQKVFLHGTCIEQWKFPFGFVIPGSTNSWEQTIYAAPPEHMLSAAQVSQSVTSYVCAWYQLSFTVD